MSERSEQTDIEPSSRRPRDPAVLAWLRLARLFAKMDHRIADFLRQWNLSVAQFDVLAQLSVAEGMTQQELADALLVTKGNISQLLTRMEGRGLLARCPEGRSIRLVLTDEGRRLAREVVPAQEAMVAACFGGLCREEQRQLGRLLRVVERCLDRQAPPQSD